MWRWPSWLGASGEWFRWRNWAPWESGPARRSDGRRRGSCAGCIAACTRSVGRCCRVRGGGWRRSWRAGPARCSVTSAPRCIWNLLQYEPPRPEVTAPASRKGVPGIRLHRSRSLDAQDTTTHQGIPTTTSHRTLLDIAAQVPEPPPRASAGAGRAPAALRPQSHHRDHRESQRPPRHEDPHHHDRKRPPVHPRRARSAHAQARTRPRPAAAQLQRLPRCPRPPRSRGRLLLPDASPGRGDRRLGHPPHPPGVRR